MTFSAPRASLALPAGSLPDSPAAWRRLVLAFAVGTIGNAGNWTAVTLMPVLQQEFDLSRAEASWPYIAIMTGFLLASPVLGRWSDRVGIAPVLAASALLCAAGFILGGLSGQFPVYLMTQFLVGIGTAAGFAPLTAELSHWFARHRGLALGIAGTSAYVAGLFWSALIPRLLTITGWQQVQMIIGASMFLMLPLAFAMRGRAPASALRAADQIAAQNSARAGLRPGTVTLLLGLTGFGCCLAMAMPQVHILAHCIDLGFTLSQGGGLISAMMLAGISSRVGVGFLIDRIGALKILIAALALQALSLVLFALSSGMVSLYVMAVVFGLAQGGLLPAYPLIVREFLPARDAGSVMGRVIMATLVGMSAGSWISGRLYDASGSYTLPLSLGVLVSLGAMGLAGFLLARSLRRLP